MPFSALSPEGPVSLLGADALTVERMRHRNRQEACFTAKCCGAALVIRTTQGKAPHFMHKAVPAGCEGERGETPEHRRLKEVIANQVVATNGWEVETEAVHRHVESRELLWRADVLASRARARVAFEVQLSHADYEQMRTRQERYRSTGVRGLWFVRTKKGFPVSQELPVFSIECEDTGDWVSLASGWDWPFICPQGDGAEYLELAEFVRAALKGNLKWAPFERAGDTWLNANVDYAPEGACPSCGRTVAGPFCVRVSIANVGSYPEFQFARLGGFRRRSDWYQPLIQAVWARVREQATETLRGDAGTCSWCSSLLGERQPMLEPGKTKQLACTLQLKDLPKPRFGTVERDWLRRWAVLER